MIKHIENNFKDVVLDSKTLVLVDFYATWCGPCQMLSPVLEEISVENNDFEIVKGKMDDVFLNITGKKLGGGSL